MQTTNLLQLESICYQYSYIYGKDEHVGVIERAIRVIKERCRCVCHAIPYKYYTKLMLRSLIAVVIRWINAFPSKGSISSTMSPAMIVEGKNNPVYRFMKWWPP